MNHAPYDLFQNPTLPLNVTYNAAEAAKSVDWVRADGQGIFIPLADAGVPGPVAGPPDQLASGTGATSATGNPEPNPDTNPSGTTGGSGGPSLSTNAQGPVPGAAGTLSVDPQTAPAGAGSTYYPWISQVPQGGPPLVAQDPFVPPTATGPPLVANAPGVTILPDGLDISDPGGFSTVADDAPTVAMAPPTVATPAAPAHVPGDATTPAPADSTPVQTAPGLPVPPYAENITSADPAPIDPTTLALTTVGLVTLGDPVPPTTTMPPLLTPIGGWR